MNKSPDEEMHRVRSCTKKPRVAREVFWFPYTEAFWKRASVVLLGFYRGFIT